MEEFRREGYLISTDPAKLDLDVIHGFITNSYWARGRSREDVETAVHNSFCFGVYEGDRQIGFARVITDFAVLAYVADVFILEEYRGRGLGKWLMECVVNHPRLQRVKKWMLATRDAHGLYAKFGFHPPERPEIYMERRTGEAF
ncbi:MAG: N-acetyltransferase [Calditrichaeota bacterium]|nr:MAG: N-acetyltransferase [Calditrichota bacterium]